MSNYYITKPDGTQEGPYDKATLIPLVKNHTYSPDSYICIHIHIRITGIIHAQN